MLTIAFVAAARLAKCFALAFPAVVAVTVFSLTKPSDLIYVVAISVICTLLAVSAFVNSYVNFESRFVQWFSHMTSSPRWFTIWLLVMVLWVPLRHLLLEHGQLSSDADFVVATILWSCVPYMVENLLKATTAKQMALLTDLLVEIRASCKRSETRDETSDLLLERVLEAITAPEEVTNA